MNLMLRWRAAAGCLLLTICLWGPGRAAVSEHLFAGRIIQGRVYHDPNQTAPLYLFVLEVETDETVGSVEFMTPAGRAYAIPAEEFTVAGDTETYHWVREATHVWEHWGYFQDPNALAHYGDGPYTIVVHYSDGSREQTTVLYGIPDTNQPIPMPTQTPSLQWPPHNAPVASPLTFTWEPVTDPNVMGLYVNVLAEDNEPVALDLYDVNATGSAPYALPEGLYQVEFALESFYSVESSDGVPFDVLKTNTLLRPFEVVAGSVYRFWSPTTGRHFYTINEREKNKLIQDHSDVWTFEGRVFYAWSTPYDARLAPVHRFWSSSLNSHFYTISEGEKNKLIDQYSHVWTYEDVAFYAYAPDNPPADVDPVFRFWKPADSTHFYTIDPGERDKLITQYADVYTFEGIAFYAWR